MLFYNINITTATRIMRSAGICFGLRFNFVFKKIRVQNLHFLIRDKFYVNFILRKKRHLRALKKLETYRGLRYAANLPVRGQRTRTNAKTRIRREIL